MTATTRIFVGTLLFDGGDGFDDGFYLSKTTGLDDAVGHRRDVVPYPSSHGIHDLPGYLEPRIIGVEGSAYASSAETQLHQRLRYTGLLAGGGKARMTIEHQGTTFWCDVAREGQPAYEITLYGAQARYQAQFLAADPRLYGEMHNPIAPAGVPVEVAQYGNFPSNPVMRVTGSMPNGYGIYGPNGALFIVSLPVTTGHPHVIDFRSGRLFRDGVVIAGAVQQGQTWTVPGGTVVSQVLDSIGGTGTLQVDVLDTYV